MVSLWHGLPTMPHALTAGLPEAMRRSRGSGRPAVGGRGTVGRPLVSTQIIDSGGSLHVLSLGLREASLPRLACFSRSPNWAGGTRPGPPDAPLLPRCTAAGLPAWPAVPT